MRLSLPLAVLFTAVLAPLAPAQDHLEMGKMWTFENPPLAYLKKTYGFAPDQKWLDALRLASLRYGNGCSASFVSPHGLIMTNHHCVRGQVAQASPPDQDWVKNGFYARTSEEEVPLSGLTVQQLVKMQDITAQMNQDITEGDPDASIKRAANRARVLKQARSAHPGLRPQIVKLHQGAVFELYLYKIFDDIRLVCTPHLQTAYFGGDPDNFTYPRYCIDFAFVRAWEKGKPADTSQHYFRWKSGGAKENELVFVTGNPGSTGRLLTLAQLEYLRDAQYPILRELIDHRLEILERTVKQSAQMEKVLRTQILGLENAKKAYAGYHAGLLDEKLMARKKAAESAFRTKVQANPALGARFGKVWGELQGIAGEKTTLEAKKRFYGPGGSLLLARAIAVVRAVHGDDKARTMAHGMRVRESSIAREFFLDHLERAKRWLPEDDPWRRAVLGEGDPKLALERLAESRVTDTAFVDELLDGSAKDLAHSTDAAIRMAASIVPLIDRTARRSKALAARESELGILLGQALFACYGNKVSPDATFTLRFSDGLVKGFPFNGTIAPYRTSFYGLYARNAEFDGAFPFSLPKIWRERRAAIDMPKAVDFVATNDIIGGNSGSPVVNKKLEVVGLIFDGNIEMLPNRFLYTDTVARSVSVHVDAITEALTKIYEARRVVTELLGKTPAKHPVETAGPKK